MDVVYICKDKPANEELRYSLRTLENLPHEDVYIVGGKPRFLTNVRTIRTTQNSDKYDNAAGNIVAACKDPRISDDFILMNDDFFVMRSIDTVPRMNRGPIDEVIKLHSELNSRYYRAMVDTKVMLEGMGFKDILSYELHSPMIINKKKYLEAHELMRAYKDRTGVPHLHGRTVYGNLFGYGGETVRDKKMRRRFDSFDPSSVFVSTSDESWNNSSGGTKIKFWFKDPSKYEKY